MFRKLLSVGRMATLKAAGEATRVGSEKLIVIPVMLNLLGTGEVGRILLALSWARMLIAFPFAATNGALLRLHAEASSKKEWPKLYGTGIIGGALLGAAVGSIALLVYLVARPPASAGTYLLPVMVLGLATLVVGVRSMLTTDLRIHLRFGAVSLLEASEGLILLVSIPLAWTLGTPGLLAGFLLSALCGAIVTAIVSRRMLATVLEWSLSWLKVIVPTSLGFAVVAAIAAVLYQSARVILGWIQGPEVVAVFFAAEACVVLLATPLQYVNGIVLTLLSRKESLDQVSRKASIQHMVGILAAAVIFVFAATWLSPILMGLLYGPVKEQALPLIPILIPGAAFRILYLSTSSFYYRFANMRTIVILSVISLAVFVSTVTLLTLKQGVTGTALGVTLGNIFMGLLWFIFYVVAFVAPKRAAR